VGSGSASRSRACCCARRPWSRSDESSPQLDRRLFTPPRREQVALDEFTAALDPATEAALLDSVEEALAGRTLLLVTHRKSALRIADRVVELGPAGRVISDSSSAAGGSSATRR